MGRKPKRLSVAPLLLALVTLEAGAEAITTAQYSMPVDRYGHFALGRPHEYARLTVTTDDGRGFALELPGDEVFEDLTPRLVRLAPDEPEEILAIVSRRDSGSRLVLIRLRAGHLEIGAQSPAIGTPMRWLNPVGVADLDGDGQTELAVVSTPHISGTLKIYRRSGEQLVELAALPGFSNHVFGSTELGLSTALAIAGRMQLLVPDTTRRRLRIIALQDDRLVETGQCALTEPLTSAITLTSASAVPVGSPSARQLIVPKDCPGSP